MNSMISKKEQGIIGGLKYRPAVSILLSFDTKISLRDELKHRLKIILGKLEKELMDKYPEEKAVAVINKLKNIIQNLDYDTHRKSIAIFVSPVAEKIFYLDILVEEKIIIDESFEIRDLVYSKKQIVQYLILMLSAESSKMYLYNNEQFVQVKYSLPANVHAYERDMPEKVSHFSDPKQHKEILLDNFLHHMDEELSIALKQYPLPVFVMGAERVLGHFKKMTRHKKNITQFIHGNYLEATEPEIRKLMESYISDWQRLRQQHTMFKLEDAMSNDKLVNGIKEVWAVATQKNCQLLVVEKDFIYPARHGAHPDSIYREDENFHNTPFYIKDAVDDIMEMVLESGGDVEFVDNGALKDYGHIAMIKYY